VVWWRDWIFQLNWIPQNFFYCPIYVVCLFCCGFHYLILWPEVRRGMGIILPLCWSLRDVSKEPKQWGICCSACQDVVNMNINLKWILQQHDTNCCWLKAKKGGIFDTPQLTFRPFNSFWHIFLLFSDCVHDSNKPSNCNPGCNWLRQNYSSAPVYLGLLCWKRCLLQYYNNTTSTHCSYICN